MKDIEITFNAESTSRRRRSSETPKINISITFYSVDDSVTPISPSELTEQIESSVETGLQSYDGTAIDSSETPTVSVQDPQGELIFNQIRSMLKSRSFGKFQNEMHHIQNYMNSDEPVLNWVEFIKKCCHYLPINRCYLDLL